MRASGILMPVFSLPGPFGIGTLGKEAFAFVDFLADAKQTYWQILPIGPTGYGDSPYACRYLRCQPEELTEAMICACLASVSDTAVIPLADWLHLGSEARINTPSTQGSNWQWRLTCPLPEALAGHIAQLTMLYERAQ